MNALSYRRLTVEDTEAYRAHRLRGFQEHPEAFTSSFEEESAKPVADSAKRLAGSDQRWFWGAFDDRQLVGVVGLERELRAKNRHKGVIVGMYVLSTHRGRGAAQALLQLVMDHARGLGLTLVVLTVTEGNEGAEQLYAGAGFRRFGVEPRAILVGGNYFAKVHMACLP